MSSELQSIFAGRVGQGLDPTMVTVVAAVKSCFENALALDKLGQALAHRLGGLDITAVGNALLDVGLQAAGSRQCDAGQGMGQLMQLKMLDASVVLDAGCRLMRVSNTN